MDTEQLAINIYYMIRRMARSKRDSEKNQIAERIAEQLHTIADRKSATYPAFARSLRVELNDAAQADWYTAAIIQIVRKAFPQFAPFCTKEVF